MTRTLTILAAAFMTACGGDDTPTNDCGMSFDGKPVHCEITVAPAQGG